MAYVIYPEHKVIFKGQVKCAMSSLLNLFGNHWHKEGIFGQATRGTLIPPRMNKNIKIDPDTEPISVWKKHYPDYKFISFIRNPFDRVTSYYFYKYKRQDFSGFDKYINSKNQVTPLSYFIDVDIDFIGRFETLHEDVDKVVDMFGLEKKELPWLNRSRNHKLDYHDLYTPTTRKIVEDCYREDLSKFNYSY